MNDHLRVYLGPRRLPTAELGGTLANLPCLTFADDTLAEVVIGIGGHPDPATYLRDLASLCVGLAEQVDALPTEVTA